MRAQKPIFKHRCTDVWHLERGVGTLESERNFILARGREPCGPYEGGKLGRCLNRDARVSHHRHTAQHQTYPSQIPSSVLLRALPRLSRPGARRDRAGRCGRWWAAILTRDDVSRSREQGPRRWCMQGVGMDADDTGGALGACRSRPGRAAAHLVFSPMKCAPEGRFSNVEGQMFDA